MSRVSELLRMMIEVTPHRVGQRVTVSPSCQFASDWPGEYVITAARWEYQNGHEVNFSIASDDEIVRRHGDTDGWRSADLVPVFRNITDGQTSQVRE
jgi:hypothetical protein